MADTKTFPALGRRAFLAGSALAAIAPTIATSKSVQAAVDTKDRFGGFNFEVTHTDAEWREKLGDKKFAILREQETELPTSSDYYKNNDPGIYHCKGCDKALYSSEDYSPQQIGYVFFRHSLPMSVILSKHSTDYHGAFPEERDYMESNCSRCGGHLGHIVLIKGEMLHCINGTVLELKAA